MKISVIIPVYNVEAYLEECLDSVLCQPFFDFEIICVEDCSQDRSMEILRKYNKEYDNFVLLENDRNRGLSYSRNRGLEYAKGKYVLFVDSDDMIEKDALGQLYGRAEKDRLEIVYFNKKTICDRGWQGEQKEGKEPLFGEEGVFTGKECFVRFLTDYSLKSMNAYTQFFLRDFLIKNKLSFYDGIVHEDFLFYFQCAMGADRVGNMDRDLYIYRKRKNSITENVTELHKQSMFITLIEVLEHWKNNEFTKSEDTAIRRFCEVIYRNCKRYYGKSNFEGKLKFGKEADDFLYEKMLGKEMFFTNDELCKMQGSNDVWIYGAGEVASDAAMYLEKNHIGLRGCLVTAKKANLQRFFGWEVWQLDEAPIRRDTLIVLAAAHPHRREMEKTLQQKKYTNIIYAIKEDTC